MRRIAVILTTVACGVAFAQESEELKTCLDKADTQLAMNMCASQEVARSDAELDRVFQRLLSAARDEPHAVESLRSLQRAWIAYRDAYLDAMYPAEDKLAAYGSKFPTDFGLLRAELTQRQTDALQEILTTYRDAR